MSTLPDQPQPSPTPSANPFALSQALPDCWDGIDCNWCFVLVSKDGGQTNAKH